MAYLAGASRAEGAPLDANAVAGVFRAVLCRPATPAETSLWSTAAVTRPELTLKLQESFEGQRVLDVRNAYLNSLARDPLRGDCGGLRNWVDTTLTRDEVKASLVASAEGQGVAEVRAAFLSARGRDPIGNDNASIRSWLASGLTGEQLRMQVAQTRPLLGVHYFPWYGRTAAGWGNGATSVRSSVVGTPLAGFYDSKDAAVMRRQIQQMEDAGFDFVILNLPADHPLVMETVNVFFQQLRGHNLRAAVQVDALYDATPEVKRQWAAEVINRWGALPEYLRLNGQPVVYLYAASIDFNLPNVELHNVYWTLDYSQGRNTYNPFGVLPPEDWPFWAASPVPVINGVAPIIPGYSDTHLNRSFAMEHPREGSRLYREQWEQAVAQHPEYIVVYSWNEYFEETAIEPTTAWGDEFVRITRCFSDKIRNRTNANCS